MQPFMEKHILKYQKKSQTKISGVQQYSHTKFRKKEYIFMACVKKKFLLLQNDFSRNIFFTQATKISLFCETFVYKHEMSMCTSEIFVPIF